MDSKEKSSGLGTEFKKFISRGHMIDLSLSVISGGAFFIIASSLAKDLLMPFAGLFFQATVNFLLLAQVFLIVTAHNRLQRKEIAAPPSTPRAREKNRCGEKYAICLNSKTISFINPKRVC